MRFLRAPRPGAGSSQGHDTEPLPMSFSRPRCCPPVSDAIQPPAVLSHPSAMPFSRPRCRPPVGDPIQPPAASSTRRRSHSAARGFVHSSAMPFSPPRCCPPVSDAIQPPAVLSSRQRCHSAARGFVHPSAIPFSRPNVILSEVEESKPFIHNPRRPQPTHPYHPRPTQHPSS